jgi:hypothetical protein
MGGTAHHKASTYNGQHSVTDVDVSMPSVDFEKRDLCVPATKNNTHGRLGLRECEFIHLFRGLS